MGHEGKDPGERARGPRARSVSRRSTASHLLSLVLLILCRASAFATTDAPTVLVVHSYHPEFAWTAELDAAIHTTITGAYASADLRTIYLDSKRHMLADIEAPLVGLLRAEYAETRVDLIIATDDNALAFLIRERDDIYGAVPVVFCGVNDPSLATGLGDRGFTGVTERFDLGANIDFMKRVLPRLSVVYAVADSTPSGQANLRQLVDASAHLDVPFRIELLFDLTALELTERLATADPDGAILNLGFWRDRSGVPLTHEQSIPLLVRSGLPVFTAWDHMVRFGTVGGVVVDATSHGRVAAEIGLRILHGASPARIDVRAASTLETVVDYQAAKDHGIDVATLPRGTRVVNVPDSLPYTRPGLFWGILALVVAEGSLIGLLLTMVSRRRTMNQALRASLEEKELLLREVHHRVKNNLQIISSLLTLQTTHVTSPERALDALHNSQRRVLSMALVHEMLYGGPTLSHIGAPHYLSTLAAQVVEAAVVGSGHAKLETNVDPSIEFSVDTAIPVGLIVSELVSNSIKHAADRGGLEIELSMVRRGDRHTLTVRDNGPGFDFDGRPRTSLGLSLVETLVRQLDASLEYRNGTGSTFTITMPDRSREG